MPSENRLKQRGVLLETLKLLAEADGPEIRLLSHLQMAADRLHGAPPDRASGEDLRQVTRRRAGKPRRPGKLGRPGTAASIAVGGDCGR